MALLLLIVGIPLGLMALLVLVGGAGGQVLPGLVALGLPVAAIAAAVGERGPLHARIGAGLLVWGAVVWLGAPAYLDRADALIGAGLSEAQAARLDALPGLTPRAALALAPAPVAAVAVAPDCDCDEVAAARVPVEPVLAGTEDLVVLPYEGSRTSMMLPISLEWNGQEVETELIFDTGATLTSIKPELLEALGYRVPDDAPRISVQTANGLRETPLLLLDRVWLGGFAIDNIAVAVCDNCGSLNGLLGLNISGNFRVEVDQDDRELIFRPEPRPNRALDAKHWLRLGLRDRGDRFTAVVSSQAPADLDALTVEVRCGDAVASVELGPLEAGGEVTGRVPRRVWCASPRMSVLYASW